MSPVRSPRPVPATWRLGPRLRDEPLGGFWVGVLLVGLATACSLASVTTAGGTGRTLGWLALALPLAVLGGALRSRARVAGARPDPILLVLAGTLVVSGLARAHIALALVPGGR